MKKKLVSTALLMGLTLLAAGCGGSSDTTAAPATGSDAVSSTEAAAPTEAASTEASSTESADSASTEAAALAPMEEADVNAYFIDECGYQEIRILTLDATETETVVALEADRTIGDAVSYTDLLQCVFHPGAEGWALSDFEVLGDSTNTDFTALPGKYWEFDYIYSDDALRYFIQEAGHKYKEASLLQDQDVMLYGQVESQILSSADPGMKTEKDEVGDIVRTIDLKDDAVIQGYLVSKDAIWPVTLPLAELEVMEFENFHLPEVTVDFEDAEGYASETTLLFREEDMDPEMEADDYSHQLTEEAFQEAINKPEAASFDEFCGFAAAE